MANLETLTDTFTNPPLDTAKWTDVSTGGGNVSVSGGVLNANTAGTGTGAVRSAASYLYGSLSYLYAKVVHGGGTSITQLGVSYNADNSNVNGRSFFQISGTTLSWWTYDQTGGGGQAASTAYNNASMAYLRLRFTVSVPNTTTYFDTSADGITWVNVGSSTRTWLANQCYAQLRTQFNGDTTARTATFDNVNFTPTPPLLETLTDTFTDTTLDTAKWTNTSSGGSATVTGGVLQLNTGGNTASGGIRSAINYTIASTSFLLAKVTISSSGTSVPRIGVSYNASGITSGGNSLMQVVGGNLQCSAYDSAGNGGLVSSFGYNITSMAWLRLRFTVSGQNVTTAYDTSPDGITWTPQATSTAKTWTAANGYVQVTALSNTDATPRVHQFDNINLAVAGPNPTPTGINDAQTLGSPGITAGKTVAPGGVNDPQTLGAPSLTLPFTAVLNPAGITDPQSIGAPAIGETETCAPAGITDAETIGQPWVGTVGTVAPGSLADAQTLDPPTIANLMTVAPSTITDAEGFSALMLDGPLFPVSPAGLDDLETFGNISLTYALLYQPDSIDEPEALDNPALAFDPGIPTPDSTGDPETVGAPALRFYPSVINPAGITDPQTITGPALRMYLFYNSNYGTGDYGVGLYQGMSIAPDPLIDRANVGEPDIFEVPPVPNDLVLPLSIDDAETLAQPILPRLDATNYHYGAGIYTEGIYYGSPGTTTDANPRDNIIYSEGTYGYGIYYGSAPPPSTIADVLPLFRDIAGHGKPPLHILGIGPWSPTIEWRGVPNYDINPGRYPARPAVALPPVTSKGFTLRLGEGSEARFDLSYPRGSAMIIDEMDTDLWWRRKDPRTKELEMIGRFNVSHNSTSTSDTIVTCSVQLDDYQTVLSARLVLSYLTPDADPPTTMWNVGTPITDILKWAIPGNTGLDLSALDTYDLGKTTFAFELPPGTSIGDTMKNLLAVSPHAWEWWVDTPLDVNKAPRLEFIVGERGTDKGVTLYDFGTGPTPIANWTRVGASDDYANAIYYTIGGTGAGKDAGGGVVEVRDADVERYGQRDVLDGNSSVVGGDVNDLRTRATNKLNKYADRRPNYQIRLAPGFWRGRGHIDIGDTIELVLQLGKEKLTDKYRVSEINVDIDENNLEEVNLNLGRLPTSADPRSKNSPIPRIVRYLKNYMPPVGIRQPDPD